ncbi:hypothetical protein L6472_06030 [Prevotella sp. E13-17]|uniref:hypothetical protein n=1 Tax=Prevotella sp. E13-17 TaxID=2913616 RepID=UPI001EDA71D7|nr:hypothetical protein [Prevotella sp. E13-17]UKK52136.1 hypothetical protein L6472_06030 [Prevotella sp. E13-17]
MKNYLLFITESVNSLPYILVEQIISKAKKKVQISDNLFLISTDKDNWRIDEVCFALSNERKADVLVVEVNKDTIMSWSVKDSNRENEIGDFFENR